MRSTRFSLGQLLAGVGGLVLMIDTWLPWYRFSLPPAVLNQVNSLAGSLGPIGAFVQQGAHILHDAGPIDLNAHEVFHAMDVEMLLLGLGALGIVLASLTREEPLFSAGDGGPVALAGGIACALVLYRLLHSPGPSEILSLRYGIWLALASGAAMIAGGLLMRAPAPAPTVHRSELADFSSASW